MRIPRKIRLGGRTIKVRFAQMEHYGEASYDKGEIVLKKGMPRDAKEATFFHECFHHMNTTVSHSTLDSLAEQTYQMLKDNKLLK